MRLTARSMGWDERVSTVAVRLSVEFGFIDAYVVSLSACKKTSRLREYVDFCPPRRAGSCFSEPTLPVPEGCLDLTMFRAKMNNTLVIWGATSLMLSCA